MKKVSLSRLFFLASGPTFLREAVLCQPQRRVPHMSTLRSVILPTMDEKDFLWLKLQVPGTRGGKQ
jgi:hypothetical protein